MSLLQDVIENPLDPGYEAAAQHRREYGEPPRSGWWWMRQVTVLVTAAAIGMGGMWAARELRQPLPGAGEARDTIVGEIDHRGALSEQLIAQNGELRDQVQELQAQAFGDSAAAANDLASELGIVTGTTPVSGPGLALTMTDGERAGIEPGSEEDPVVVDYDLQIVVNELWAAGAESIAVNGVRLTGATAIRRAGSSVLIDLQAVASPYLVEAIGDPVRMEENFSAGTAPGYLSTLNTRFGITSTLTTVDEIRLPAGTPPGSVSQSQE